MAVAHSTSAVGSVRDRLAELTFRPVWLVLGVVAGLHLLGLRFPIEVGYALLLVTIVVLGLPHGAVDHLTMPRARGQTPTIRWLAVFVVAYLALSAVYTVAWFLAPTAAFVFFILLTWFHWGQGDRAHLAVLADGDHLSDPWVSRLSIAVRGGLPMLVPLLAFPERYRSVLLTVVSLFDPAGGTWLDPLFSGEARLALGGGFLVLTLVTLALGYRVAGASDTWLVDASETALLWVFFLTVPPVLAIGVYFALWHSVRHLVRLVALDEQSVAALDRGAGRTAAWRLLRDATPLTVGALLVFGGLALLVPAGNWTVESVGGLYLVLLAVLTLPHVVVVSWLDRYQGVPL